MSSKEEEIAMYAYLSGLIQGWASALKDPKEVPRVIEDMIETSKKLAVKAGLEVE